MPTIIIQVLQIFFPSKYRNNGNIMNKIPIDHIEYMNSWLLFVYVNKIFIEYDNKKNNRNIITLNELIN